MSTQAVPKPSRSVHQRRMHPLMESRGYGFVQADGKGHNLYENQHGQRIRVPGTPKNAGHSERFLLAEIQRDERERQGVMTATAEQTDIDKYMEMVDPFLLKAPKNKLGQKARYTALVGFLHKLMEKHGPIASNDLTEVCKRLGYNERQAREAKIAANIGSYREQVGNRSWWVSALPDQVPAGRNLRTNKAKVPNSENSMVLDAPEPESVPDGEVRARASIQPEAPAEAPAQQVVEAIAHGDNGEVAAATQMLLDALGYKMPGPEVMHALDAAYESARTTLETIEAARTALRATQNGTQKNAV